MPRKTVAQKNINHSYKVNETTRQRIADAAALLGSNPSTLTQEVMAAFLDQFDTIKPRMIEINQAMINAVMQQLIAQREVFYSNMTPASPVIYLFSSDDQEQAIIEQVDQLCDTQNKDN